MLKLIKNLFFPPVCSGCHDLLGDNESVICTHCRHEIPFTNHHLTVENELYKVFYGRIALEHASALIYFTKKGITQELIHNLKYRGQEEIGRILAEWYLPDLQKITALKTATTIIPVPLHPKKLKSRGYNQASQFGQALALDLSLKYNDQLLFRKKNSQTQSKKNRLKRAEGIEKAFDVVFTEKDHKQHYILIDDVVTTGATLEACCRALLKIPGTQISIVCMAMAQ